MQAEQLSVVYLSRAGSSMRQLQAEHTLIDLLTTATAAHNAQLVVFNAAGLSVKQQAAIFGRAAAVVGVHGAAFGNMVSAAQLSTADHPIHSVCRCLSTSYPCVSHSLTHYHLLL